MCNCSFSRTCRRCCGARRGTVSSCNRPDNSVSGIRRCGGSTIDDSPACPFSAGERELRIRQFEERFGIGRR